MHIVSHNAKKKKKSLGWPYLTTRATCRCPDWSKPSKPYCFTFCQGIGRNIWGNSLAFICTHRMDMEVFLKNILLTSVEYWGFSIYGRHCYCLHLYLVLANSPSMLRMAALDPVSTLFALLMSRGGPMCPVLAKEIEEEGVWRTSQRVLLSYKR